MTISATRPSSSPTILVADDDASVRGSVVDILRLEGYTVTEADDGDVALDLLGAERFDALVLDNRMPRVDGMTVLAALENPPPAVLMSAHDVDSSGRKDLAVRGIAYLHKPVDPEHLLDAVATAVGRARRPPPVISG
ncbi:MAG TPA: response regulator [Acidimicrobiales bacterium]|nr:response regulator [Acidimicrobiales bacterium]